MTKKPLTRDRNIRGNTAILLFPLLLLLVVGAGCETTDKIKSSIKSTIASITSKVDTKVYEQVPPSQREGVPEAELSLSVVREELRLAGMRKGIANYQEEIKGYEQRIARNSYRAASYELDIKKLESIQRARLGDKEKIAKTLEELKENKIESKEDTIMTEAKIKRTKLRIDGLEKKITRQEKKIERMKIAKQTMATEGLTEKVEPKQPEKAEAAPAKKDPSERIEQDIPITKWF